MIAPADWDAFCDRSLNGTVFHTHRFLGYHPEGRLDWDHAVIEVGGSPAALWPAASRDDGKTWWSGAGASFGGPVLREDADAPEAAAVVAGLLEEARHRGYERVAVTPPPRLYERGERGLVRGALVAAGFAVARREVSQAASFAGKSAAELLAGSARRGVGKAGREGTVVRAETQYEEFHELLARDRAAVGAAPVHSAAELAELAERLGADQVLLLARRDGALVSGSWALRVNDRVGLSFYVCQDREHRRLRSTNLLLLRAMEWAAGLGLAHYDFGTSSIGGDVNEGLFAFKEAHGGAPFDRETFEIVL